MRALPVEVQLEELVAAYRRSVAQAGFVDAKGARWTIRDFCSRVGGPKEWETLSFEEQRDLTNRQKRVVRWLLVTQRAAASTRYLFAGDPGRLGESAERFHRELFDRYVATATGIGFARIQARRQWVSIWMLAAALCVSIEDLDANSFESGRDELVRESRQRWPLRRSQHFAMYLHQAGAVLF
ncbi:MAG: hypothetical protein ACRDJ2_15615, partial [Actinomycetota bacterium]